MSQEAGVVMSSCVMFRLSGDKSKIAPFKRHMAILTTQVAFMPILSHSHFCNCFRLGCWISFQVVFS